MHTVLDNEQIINQRDPQDALGVAAEQARQVNFPAVVACPEHDSREINNVVVTGMGGSALAALVVKAWLAQELTMPFEIVRGYDLPASVDSRTLVIASSYSGNTEETLSALDQARRRDAQIGVIASGGQLIDIAEAAGIAHVKLPAGFQPRMAVLYNLRSLVKLLENFGVVENKTAELESLSDWLAEQTSAWNAGVAFEDNLAKQIADHAAGKTAVFYGSSITSPVAYKWKISWNENAKNVAFWNEYPEFNHNEFMGWASHPVDKPFAVFDLRSKLDHLQINKRFEVSDRLLSGRRPKAWTIDLAGDSLVAQLLWGSILADYASIYLAVLNGINPTPVDLIEQLKRELA